MKIAVIGDPVDHQNAGIHSFTINMIQSLIKHRGDHEIIVIKTRKSKLFDNCEEIAVPTLKLLIGYSTLRLFFIIPSLLRKLQVDVVIEPAHFGPFNLPGSIIRITMIHDLTILLMPEHHKWISQRLQKIFLPRILRQTDIILTNSQNTTKDVQRLFPAETQKIKTILLGKDPTYVRDLSDTELRTNTIIGPFFHYLGTVEPRKDLTTLLHAFRIFRDQRRNQTTQLVIAGGIGWKTSGFFQELNRHPYKDDIRILGRVSKKMSIQLHSRSIAMIYPSLYEGFGLPILECLSCGGRVIAAGNSSLPEVGGLLTEYFMTRDPVSLAEKMHKVSQMQPDAEYQEQARIWTDSFSWDRYATTLVKLIEEKRKGR